MNRPEFRVLPLLALLAAGLPPLSAGIARADSIDPFASVLEEQMSVPLPVSAAPLMHSFARLPLHFVRNDGQADAATKFEVHGPGYLLSLEQTEIEMVLTRDVTKGTERPGVRRSCAAFDAQFDDERRAPVESHQPADGNGFEISAHSPKAPQTWRTPRPGGEPVAQSHLLRMKLLGPQTNAKIIGEEELPGKFNFFLGNDPALWRRDVPSFAKVRYREVYPGIDLVFYGDEGQLEYDFVLAPGANANQIQFAIEGADRLEVDREGNLRLAVADQELRWRQPMIYQEKNGYRVPVAGEYVLGPAVACNSNTTVREVAFHIAPYDQKLALVIDPVLVYGTFLGASDGATYATSIAAGPEGSVYVAGRTTSSSFPTQGALMPTNSGGGWSFYLTKLDAAGQIVYSTYIGPIGNSPYLPKIAVDQSGSVYMGGNCQRRSKREPEWAV